MTKFWIAKHAGRDVAFSAKEREYSHAAVSFDRFGLVVERRFGRPDLARAAGDLPVGHVIVPVVLGELSDTGKADAVRRKLYGEQRAATELSDAAKLWRNGGQPRWWGGSELTDELRERNAVNDEGRAAKHQLAALKLTKQLHKLVRALRNLPGNPYADGIPAADAHVVNTHHGNTMLTARCACGWSTEVPATGQTWSDWQEVRKLERAHLEGVGAYDHAKP